MSDEPKMWTDRELINAVEASVVELRIKNMELHRRAQKNEGAAEKLARMGMDARAMADARIKSHVESVRRSYAPLRAMYDAAMDAVVRGGVLARGYMKEDGSACVWDRLDTLVERLIADRAEAESRLKELDPNWVPLRERWRVG